MTIRTDEFTLFLINVIVFDGMYGTCSWNDGIYGQFKIKQNETNRGWTQYHNGKTTASKPLEPYSILNLPPGFYTRHHHLSLIKISLLICKLTMYRVTRLELECSPHNSDAKVLLTTLGGFVCVSEIYMPSQSVSVTCTTYVQLDA